MFDTLNLILLAVAVIVIWRLYGVLGSRTGNERAPLDPLTKRSEPTNRLPPPAGSGSQQEEPDVHAPQASETPEAPVWAGVAAEGSELAKGLQSIASLDRTFATGRFLGGAKIAYEMIVEAFARGDKEALKPLLSKDVFGEFQAEIDRRLNSGEKLETTFVGFRAVEIMSANLQGSNASIGVRFHAQMISATRAASGEVMQGDSTKVQDVTDTWTFERDLKARDPNWRLASTAEPA